jgi:hypothetical protein
MATDKSLRCAKHVGTIFTELEASCFDYVLLWTSPCFVYKPLVIVRSLAHKNIYKFWIRIAFNGVYQRYNSYTMANICEDSALIWIMNMNIKYLTKLKLNSRSVERSNRREEHWIAAKVQIMVKIEVKIVRISGW